MYYNRTNKPGCQEKISAVLNILWQVSGPQYLFVEPVNIIHFCELFIFIILSNSQIVGPFAEYHFLRLAM